MFDIISIGDATIDTFLFISDIAIKETGGKRQAVLSWGDKLPVEKLYRSVAGNAANNAVGSARLGLKTGFYTVLAHDAGGREIVHKMEKEGVSGRYIVKNDKHGTNASTVLAFNGDRTIFVYHERRQYELPNFVHSSWIYLTSLGEGFGDIYPALAKYLDRYQARLGFNPGTYQLRAGPKANKVVLERTDVLSLNVQEAQSWVGCDTKDPQELCLRLSRLGPKAIALTDGRKGAYSLSAEGFFYIPAFPGPCLEATGAGDAFTAAYLAALVLGKTHQEALRWGPVNAGSVVRQVGPQAGLLGRRQLEEQLKKRKKFQPVAIATDRDKEKVLKIAARQV